MTRMNRLGCTIVLGFAVAGCCGSGAQPQAAKVDATTEPAVSTAQLVAMEGSGDMDGPRVPWVLQAKVKAAFAARKLPGSGITAYSNNFTTGYCMAIVSPSASFSQGGSKPSDAGNLGFQDGIAAGKHDSPLPADQFVKIFEAKGYTRQTVVGDYSSGFKQSDFTVAGEHGKWWLLNTPCGQVAGPGRFSVTGLVAPKGSYGHLSAYEREILVLEAHAAP